MSWLRKLTGVNIDLNPFDKNEALEIDLLGGGKKSTTAPAAASSNDASSYAAPSSAVDESTGIPSVDIIGAINDLKGKIPDVDIIGAINNLRDSLPNNDGLMAGQENISDSIGAPASTVNFNYLGEQWTPDLNDVLQSLKVATGLREPTKTEIGKYDINSDGVIDTADSRLITRAVQGIVDEGTAATGLYGQFADQNKMLTDRFDTAISDIGTANTALTGLGTNVDALGTNLGTVGTNIGTIGTNLGTLQGDVTQGFADTAQGFVDQGQRFNDLDTSVGNVQSAVDTGFTNQQTNFDNRTDALNEAFGNIDTNAAARIGELQTNVIEGQGGLGDRLSDLTSDVGTVQGNLDTYAGQLLENQGIMTDNQGNFQTNFGAFIDRYGTDTTRADQARADLQTGQGNILDQAAANQIAIANAQAAQQGSADALSAAQDAQSANVQDVLEQGFTDQSRIDSLTQDQLAALAGQTQTAQDTLQQGFADQSSATGETQGLMSEGFAGLQSQATDTQNALQQGLNNINAQNNVLADQMSTTDDTTQAILAAFDAQGNLKRSEVRADGTLVGRSLDANGLLIESNYSPRGELLSTNVLDTRKLGGDITGIMSQAA